MKKSRLKRICVNCGSSPGLNPVYLEAAKKLGSELAKRGIELVYGGADVGLMGEVADTVMQKGGVATGVIPKAFAHKVSHSGLTKLHIADDMHDRKAMMFDMSDGFIALPGGFGTLEEVLELLTWAQLGLSKKPCGLLNVNGYFKGLLAFLDHAVGEGFIKQVHRDMLVVCRTPEEILDTFESYRAPDVEKWVGIKRGAIADKCM